MAGSRNSAADAGCDAAWVEYSRFKAQAFGPVARSPAKDARVHAQTLAGTPGRIPGQDAPSGIPQEEVGFGASALGGSGVSREDAGSVPQSGGASPGVAGYAALLSGAPGGKEAKV